MKQLQIQWSFIYLFVLNFTLLNLRVTRKSICGLSAFTYSAMEEGNGKFHLGVSQCLVKCDFPRLAEILLNCT